MTALSAALDAATILGCLLYLAWLSGYVFLGMVGVLVLGLTAYMLLQRRARAAVRPYETPRGIELPGLTLVASGRRASGGDGLPS